MRKSLLTLLPLLLIVGGCAHNLSKEALALADRTISFSKLSENPDAFRGKTVILGGVIRKTTQTPHGTRLEVQQYSLDGREMPDETSDSGGRFLANVPERLAGSICGTGLLVSMAGQVMGKEAIVSEEKEFSYPLIGVRELRIIRPPNVDFFRTWIPYGP